MRGERLDVANKKARKTFYKYHLMHPRMYWYDTERDVTYPHLGAYRKTKVFCSNPWCCGNGRRQKHTHNVTMQELKADEAMKFELNEWRYSQDGQAPDCKSVNGGSSPSAASNLEKEYESKRGCQEGNIS